MNHSLLIKLYDSKGEISLYLSDCTKSALKNNGSQRGCSIRHLKRINEQPIVVDDPLLETQAPALPEMTSMMSNASAPEPALAAAATTSTTPKEPYINRYGRDIK